MIGVTALNTIEVHVGQTELDIEIVELFFAALTGFDIHAPAAQVPLIAKIGKHGAERTFGRITLDRRVRLETAVHDDPIAFFPRIDHVQYIARFKFKPANLLLCAVARHDAKAARNIAAELHDAMSGLA